VAEETCANCRHYVEILPASAEEGRPHSGGMCRRYPPQLVQVRGAEGEVSVSPLHPTVFGNQGCGEFAPRREKVN
jgi:hypothetical protein